MASSVSRRDLLGRTPLAGTPAALSPRRLLEESLPLAGIVLLWSLVAAVVGGYEIAGTVRIGGLAMGLLYAVVRGIGIGRALEESLSFDDPLSLLRENVAVLLPAVVWFLLARLVPHAVDGVLHGLFDVVGPTAALTTALATTGVLTVVLYAVAVGTHAAADDGVETTGAWVSTGDTNSGAPDTDT